MTHHFFLTARALYVLVADDRKDDAEFDYWFRIINLLGREREKEEKVSILVLLNKIQYEGVSSFNLDEYKKAYPNMAIEKWEVDFSKDDAHSRGLIVKIQEMICSLPHIGNPLPSLWKPIRDDLLERREQDNHISFGDFAKICKEDRKGLNLEEEEDQRSLSRYLHRLGVMLHYQGDEDDDLDNFIILNPQWAVDAVYSVLKDGRVEKGKGRFTKADLKDFWEEYDSNERDRLLSLMLKDKFEICYPVPHSSPQTYIAPELLPATPPAYEWESADTLKFRLQYPFIPKGLIARLIIRLSEDIAEDGSLVWKKGVVIERNDCRAQVIQKKPIGETATISEMLEIEISGPKKKRLALLEAIISQVERIHKKSFKHIVFAKMIPCNCEDCKGSEEPTFFTYSELQQYEEEDVDKIRCKNQKIKDVSVAALLGEVSERGRFRENSNLEEAKRCIEKDQLMNAIQKLQDIEHPDFEEKLLELSGKLSRLKKKVMRGSAKQEDVDTERARIRTSVSSLYSELKKENGLPSHKAKREIKPSTETNKPVKVEIVEKKKPWYKRVGIILGIIAASIAVIAGIAEATGSHLGDWLQLLGFGGWD